jgi:hypothetical protein
MVGGHTWPTPYPMPEGASSDRHGGTVVPGDGGLGLVLEGALPVLAAPAGGVGGIDRDDDESGVEGHGAQSFPELCGRHACDGAAELLAPASSAHGLAAGGAGVVEAEVFDGDPGTVVLVRETDQVADRRTESPVTLTGWARSGRW